MIYFYHIWKTGGRSTIYAFMKEAGCSDPEAARAELGRAGVMSIGGRLFAHYGVWSRLYCPVPLEKVYFASHHTLMRDVHSLPDDAFRFTIFRDPLLRVMSRYRSILNEKALGILGPNHPRVQYAGKHILEFIERAPRPYILAQLGMFAPSDDLDINRALEAVRGLDLYFRLEEYEQGLRELGLRLGLELPVLHIQVPRRLPEVEQKIQAELTPGTKNRLRRFLAPEYAFLGELQ